LEHTERITVRTAVTLAFVRAPTLLAYSAWDLAAFSGGRFALTCVPPYFNPGPDPTVTAPPIWLGGVNASICQLAGATASGFVTHPTNSTPRHLGHICRPNLGIGARHAGRRVEELELASGGSSGSSARPRRTVARSSSTAGTGWRPSFASWSAPDDGRPSRRW